MTITQLAAHDQKQTELRERRRRADRRIQRALLAVLGFGLMLGGYAILAVEGWVPAAPWSPVGQAQIEQQHESPAVNLDDFDIPEGWAPAVPVKPAAPKFDV